MAVHVSEPPEMEEMTANADALAALLGMERRKLFLLQKKGELPAAAGRGRYPVAATVRAYVESLSGEAELREVRAEMRRAELEKLRIANERERGDSITKEEASNIAKAVVEEVQLAVNRAKISDRDRRAVLERIAAVGL